MLEVGHHEPHLVAVGDVGLCGGRGRVGDLPGGALEAAVLLDLHDELGEQGAGQLLADVVEGNLLDGCLGLGLHAGHDLLGEILLIGLFDDPGEGPLDRQGVEVGSLKCDIPGVGIQGHGVALGCALGGEDFAEVLDNGAEPGSDVAVGVEAGALRVVAIDHLGLRVQDADGAGQCVDLAPVVEGGVLQRRVFEASSDAAGLRALLTGVNLDLLHEVLEHGCRAQFGPALRAVLQDHGLSLSRHVFGDLGRQARLDRLFDGPDQERTRGEHVEDVHLQVEGVGLQVLRDRLSERLHDLDLNVVRAVGIVEVEEQVGCGDHPEHEQDAHDQEEEAVGRTRAGAVGEEAGVAQLQQTSLGQAQGLEFFGDMQ